MNTKRLLMWLAIALVAAWGGFTLRYWIEQERLASNRDESVVGTKLPEFTAITPERNTFSSDELAGQPAILNFWASWCQPCVREIPALMQTHAEFSDRGLQVLGVAYDNHSSALNFAVDIDINYPIVVVEHMQTSTFDAAVGNPRSVLPFTVAVDEEGIIKRVHAGELSAAEFADMAQSLLAAE